jgi:RND family efflux transporter MFP subunit
MASRISLKALSIILPLVALGAYTGYRVYQSLKSESQQSAAGRGGPGGPRVQTVQTDVVMRGRIGEFVTLTGPLRAKETVDVSPRLAGRVTELKVDTGQMVERGALLAVIEDDELQQQLDRSRASVAVVDATIAQREAELANAKAELDRRKNLVAEGLLAQSELDAAEMRHRVTLSQLELARAQKRQSEAEQRELTIRQGQTRIHAPISGVIARRQVDLGALVTQATPIVTLVNISTMIMDANVTERDVARIRLGSQATVIIDSLGGQPFAGRVMRISPLLDPQTRNGRVEIEIQNRGGTLKGEMFARVELDLGSSRETLLIPRDALIYRGDQPGVYDIEDGAARFLTVETGLTQEDKVEVLGGLQAGQTIITRGANLLKDGDRVRVLNAGGQGGPRRQEGQGAQEGQNAPRGQGGPGGQAGQGPQRAN